VTGGQSDIGINGVAEGRFNIGDSSRDPIIGVDPKGLVFTKIARDGVCVITNKGNPIGNMSTETVVNIFTGTYRDWSQVPGSSISGPIDLFDRDSASGTQDAFTHIFLEETKKVSPAATAETSNGLEQQAVQSDKQAVGFVSFAYTGGTNAVGYQGVPCTLRNAKSGQYGGVRNFWMVTKGAPKGESAKFLSWVTRPGNKTVRNIVNTNWIAIH
jgi:phosphate transport system substrate-binding protein